MENIIEINNLTKKFKNFTAVDNITFSIVFQDPSLDDDLTAYENLDMHGMLYKVKIEDRKKRIKQLLEFVELWDRKDDFVKHFSGGMKRRLEIARGFLHHPKVLFLDEPTIGLDPQTRNHIWTYLKKMNKEEGTTVFLTTHYMEEADKVSNRIAIIDHGKIVARGTADELKKQTNKNSLEEAFLAFTGSAYTLWIREIKKYFRSKSRIFGSLGQPILFLVALGFGLGPIFQKAGQGNYIEFLSPGIISMSILFMAIFSGIYVSYCFVIYSIRNSYCFYFRRHARIPADYELFSNANIFSFRSIISIIKPAKRIKNFSQN